MKKIILMGVCGIFLYLPQGLGQGRKCGAEVVKQILTSRDPSYPLKARHTKEHIAAQIGALGEKSGNVKYKTTAPVTIPIVFHIVLTSTQINTLGGITGIRQRVISQVTSLNKDFNSQNPDQALVPSAFKPLIGNPQIQIGLAHRKPDGTATEGFEIVTTTTPSFSVNDLATGAKHASSGGADAWDPTKYINVWVVNLGGGGILGFTLVPNVNNYTTEDGVVLNYGAFGVRSSPSDYYLSGIDRGRTLTHELGHFFHLEHIWGDDGGLCPLSNGQNDDGISDTPPQKDFTYNSHHPNKIIPYPLYDDCTPTGSGIMWMNYMDYVDDAWMYMFTAQQATWMRAILVQGNYPSSLTQHPELLQWPTDVAEIEKTKGISLFPNPSTGVFSISFVDTKGLKTIDVVNIMGQKVHSINADNTNISNYNVDLTGMAKGVYMVRCTFEQGTVTRKIVLQ